MQHQILSTRLRAAPQLGSRTVEVVLSTDQLARDGHVLDPGGCVLGNYQRNPIVLWQHEPTSPVGRASDLAVYHDRIAARIDFAPLSMSAIADTTCDLVKSGIVNSVSVGFDILEAEPLDPKQPRAGQHIGRWELLEVSFVSIPADTGAIVTARHYHRTAPPSRAEVLLAKGREHIRAALDFHRDIGRCLDRDDIKGAEYPHRQQFFPIRAAHQALDEAADLTLPSHGAEERLADAIRHVQRAIDAHQRLGRAIDRNRRSDCENAHDDLGRSLRGSQRCLRETESPVVPAIDADLVAKLAPAGGPRSLPRVDPRGGAFTVAHARAEQFARVMAGAAALRCLGDPPSFAERQALKARLRR